MASFIIASPEIDPAVFARLDAAQQNAGYRPGFRREVAGWRVVSYAPLCDAPDHVYEREDGHFLVCAGYLIYRGRTGKPALRAMLEDLLAERVDYAKLYGHYALILGEPGRLRLLNDRLNGFKTYHDKGDKLFSSMFMSVFDGLPSVSVNLQGLYEFVWLGTPHRPQTFIDEIQSVGNNIMLTFDERGVHRRQLPPPNWLAPDMSGYGMDELVVHCGGRVVEVLGALADQFGDKLNTALSGGFDSRLILAALLARGTEPHLFSYGKAGDRDRQVASATAAAVGLELEAIDKSKIPVAPRQSFANQVARSAIAFDGWKPTGIFDNGSDMDDRIHRLNGMAAIINGSGGECLRNFFYLPDGRYTLDQLVSTFYSTYSVGASTDAFDERGFRAQIAAQLAEELGADPGERLDRSVVELAYPLFRVRYWSSRDMAANQRFGWAYYPFLQPQLIAGTAGIPLRYKTHGRLEARLIRALSPKLAAQMSDYGFRFDQPTPMSYRLQMLVTYMRPTWARRYSYRVRYSVPRHRPYFLQPDYLGEVIDPDLPHMRAYFHPDRLHDEDAFNRAATVEYLLERHKAGRHMA